MSVPMQVLPLGAGERFLRQRRVLLWEKEKPLRGCQHRRRDKG